MARIYDEFVRQRDNLERVDLQPRTVVFSHAGFSAMLNEAESHSACGGPTYCGLPHMINPEQTEDVVVSDKTVEELAARRRPPVSFRVDHPRKATMTVAGENMTEAQLCDVVMAHCQPHIDAGTQTPLQRALYSAVVNFGRFE